MADPVGISIAFEDPWYEPDPTWTRIDNLAGCRVQGWTIDRGRANEFEKTGTGTATIRLVDREGLFDPTAGSYTVVPSVQAAISLFNPINETWHTLFRGFVESWRYRLDPTRQYLNVEIELVDGFAILARAELQVGVDGALPPFTGLDPDVAADLNELAAGNILYGYTEGTLRDRLEAILEDVGWPSAWMVSGTDLFSGNVRAAPKAYGPGTSALDALWDAADAEFPGVANLYIAGPSAPGHLVFHGRQPRFRPDVAEYGIQRWTVGDPSGVDLDPDDTVPVSELEWSLGNDNLYNACSATPEKVGEVGTFRQLDPAKDDVAGQLVVADDVGDTASIPIYGRQSLTFDNLQTALGIHTGNDPLVETKLFATYYVTNYKDPHPRISRMVFKSRHPADPSGPKLWEYLCNAEISDLLTVKTKHPGATPTYPDGAPSGGGFDHVDFYVEGIHYTCRPGGTFHADLDDDRAVAIVELSLDVSPRAHWTTNPFDEDPNP